MPNLVTVGAANTASTVAGIPFYTQSSSIYTHDVSGTDDSAENNSAYGLTALDAITTGDKNTAIGYETLKMMGANADGHGSNTALVISLTESCS